MSIEIPFGLLTVVGFVIGLCVIAVYRIYREDHPILPSYPNAKAGAPIDETAYQDKEEKKQ